MTQNSNVSKTCIENKVLKRDVFPLFKINHFSTKNCITCLYMC